MNIKNGIGKLALKPKPRIEPARSYPTAIDELSSFDFSVGSIASIGFLTKS